MGSWMRDTDDDRARSRNTFQLEPRYRVPGGRPGRGSLGDLVTGRRGLVILVVIGVLVALVAIGSVTGDADEATDDTDLATAVQEAEARAGFADVTVRSTGDFTVVLEGSVGTDAERMAAERVARAQPEVITVENELTVTGTETTAEASALAEGTTGGPATAGDLALQNRLSTIAAATPVQFESASDQLLAESLGTLDELAAALIEAPAGTQVLIVGHTDSDGEPADNLALSQARADAVRSYLVQQGVDEATLTTEGRGDTEPIADNETQQGKARNRRIEFLVVPS